MHWNYTLITRMVLLLLLFQFISPACLPIETQNFDAGNEKSPCLHLAHNWLIISLALQENEENKFEENVADFNVLQLLDYSGHSRALTELLHGKFKPISSPVRYTLQPRLFTIFCTYLI